MRATLAALSKASRAPLTSKQGNKEFYKGHNPSPSPEARTLQLTTRTHSQGPEACPASVRNDKVATRQGSKAPYILMRERMRTFVVPQGLDSSDVSLAFFP